MKRFIPVFSFCLVLFVALLMLLAIHFFPTEAGILVQAAGPTIKGKAIGEETCANPGNQQYGKNEILVWKCDQAQGASSHCSWLSVHRYCPVYSYCSNVTHGVECKLLDKAGKSCSCGTDGKAADGTSHSFQCGQYTDTCANNTVCYSGAGSQPHPGVACLNPGGSACKCDSEGNQATGQNGRTCLGTHSYCPVDHYCTQGSCVPLARRCENKPTPAVGGPGVQGPQKNGSLVIRYDKSGKEIGRDSAANLAKNGITNAFCPSGDICQDGPNGTTNCIKGTCSCEHPGQNGVGQNGIACGGFAANQQTSDTNSTGNYCSSGVECTEPNPGQPTCSQKVCDCEHSDNKGAGNNGKTCGGFKASEQNPPNFCPADMYCHQAGNHNPQCLPLDCSCKSANKEGAGNNTFLCGTENREVAICGVNEICVDTPRQAHPEIPGNPTIEVPICQKLNCTCANPGVSKARNCGTTSVNYDCPDGQVCTGSGTNTSCKAASPTSPPPTLGPPPQPPCAQFANDGTGKCLSVVTALSLATPGSIGTSTDPVAFIEQIFQVLLGVGGGIALLLIMFSGYQFMVSQGKPEALQKAREQLIAAIVGVLFLIFSLVILEAIGVDLLHIPGLGK